MIKYILSLLFICMLAGCARPEPAPEAETKKEDDTGDIEIKYGSDSEEEADSSDDVSVIYTDNSDIEIKYNDSESSDEPAEEYVYDVPDVLSLKDSDRSFKTTVFGGSLIFTVSDEAIYIALRGTDEELYAYHADGKLYMNRHNFDGSSFYVCDIDRTAVRELFRIPESAEEISSVEDKGETMFKGWALEQLHVGFNINGVESKAVWFMSPGMHFPKYITYVGSTENSPFDGVTFSLDAGHINEPDWMAACEPASWDTVRSTLYTAIDNLLTGDKTYVVETYDEETVPDDVKDIIEQAIENSEAAAY